MSSISKKNQGVGRPQRREMQGQLGCAAAESALGVVMGTEL